MPDAASDRIRRLEEENAELRELVAYLKDELTGDDLSFPREWGLRRSEARMFGCLVGSVFASRDMLMTALYFDKPGEEPAARIIAVQMVALRRKLAPFGIEIGYVPGWGYSLSEDVRARFRKQRIAA